MRTLLFISFLLAVTSVGCAGTDIETTHTAVTKYLKKNLNDPGSYEDVRWGAAEPFTRADSLKSILQPIVNNLKDYAMQRSFVEKAMASPAFRDTTRVGTRLTHAYRAKNRLGALVLDSAQFVVYKNGAAQQL